LYLAFSYCVGATILHNLKLHQRHSRLTLVLMHHACQCLKKYLNTWKKGIRISVNQWRQKNNI